MEVQNVRFCQECGREILEDFGFCPACGAFYDKPRESGPVGSANVRTEQTTGPSETEQEAARAAYQAYMTQLTEQIYVNNMRITIVMLGIWVGLSAVISLCLLSGSGMFFDWVKAAFGMGSSPLYEAVIVGVSGILALVSAIICSQRKLWSIAFYSCFGSTVLTALLIFFNDRICIYFFLCGLLASLRVRNLRPMFE